jgi:hypothetical protein
MSGNEATTLAIVVGAGAGTAIGVTLRVAMQNATVMLAGPIIGTLLGSLVAVTLKKRHER